MDSPQIKRRISDMMREVRRGRIPSSAQVVAQAFEELSLVPERISRDQARQNFGDILRQVWRHTLTVLERYEEQAYAQGIPGGLIDLLPEAVAHSEEVRRDQGFEAAVIALLSAWYPYLREAFLSVSQSRKTRGGGDFELQFAGALKLAGIPFQEIKRTFRVDFMIPSDEIFRRNRTVAVVASAKRTLRERWREVVEELQALRSPNIFLVTANGEVGSGHVRQICHSYGIHLVVWDHLKQRQYADEPLVLGYTQWASERIPALEQFWQ